MSDPYPREREPAAGRDAPPDLRAEDVDPYRTASPCWSCVICAGESTRIFVQHGIGVRRCVRCGHEFAEFTPAADHVSRVYGDDYFFGGKAGYSDYPSEAELLREHGRRYAWLLRRFVDPGRVLDVGAAAGYVLEGLLDEGWNGIAIEPNARMAALARARLRVPVHVTTLERFRGATGFDLVTMIQVVAHFSDVRRALAVAAEATRVRGWWLIETWNRSDWLPHLLGRQWHEYSPPSVLHWFDPEGLRRLAGEFGFEQVAIGRPRKRLVAAHAKSLLRYKLATQRPGLLGRLVGSLIPDSLPIPYPFTDLFWAVYRRR